VKSVAKRAALGSSKSSLEAGIALLIEPTVVKGLPVRICLQNQNERAGIR
jgi:hypothetical protein